MTWRTTARVGMALGILAARNTWLTTSDKIMALDRSGTLLLEFASENARQWIVTP